MGGGDLNLKKSWHPHTLKNQEKVWKAEKAKDQEERKLQDLRKEIEQEKSREELKKFGESTGVLAKTDNDKKLEWMYQSSTQLINREEYLLGRKIDKSFELLQAEEQSNDQKLVGVKQPLNHVEHECIPFSIRAYRGNESTEQVDLQRKVMEDPLMLIKQREMESRRKLLENPVKLKELHRILKTDEVLNKASSSKSKKKSKKSKSKKSKKSKKKHKKRSKSSSSSSPESASASESESDDDIDRKLAKRYKKLKGSLIDEQDLGNGMTLSKLLDAKYETISKELDRAADSKTKSKTGLKKERSRSRSNDRHRSRSRSPYPNRDSHRRQQRDDRRERRRSPPTTNRNRNEYRRSRSRSPRNNSRPSNTATSKKQTLTEEEKQARCQEMMKNAEWRESERSSVVQKHRDAYEKEEQYNRSRDFDKNFINKEVKKAIANHTSIGSRIRSNLNNIQRTQSSMNSNFSRK